ncbi:MAG TPA: hypothetical protein VFW06_00815 [Acidimicrobiia bacterium]|nr:hypothetical protein [Acidimicrobiia bacterium]
MEHTADRPDDVDAPGTGTGTDRDLAALEALEQELASLEGEHDRVEQVSPLPPPDAPP